MPLILVGGGSILIDSSVRLSGTSVVHQPDHYSVANAIGAALSQVAGIEDIIVPMERESRELLLEKLTQTATQRAVEAGADAGTVQVIFRRWNPYITF